MDAATTISFDLIQGSWNDFTIKLYGMGTSQYLTRDSGKFTLVKGGTYYLRIVPKNETTDETRLPFTFRVNSHDAAELTVGTAYSGTISASRYAKLFQVTTDETKILEFLLDSNAAAGRNEIYVKYGSAPTRTEYDYASATGAPDQSLYIDNAAPGTYYVLVYSDYCPVKANYTLTATMTNVRLEDYVQTGVGMDTLEFAISGAGFDDTVQVYVVNTETGIATAAESVRVTGNGQLAAVFDKTLPVGGYTLRLVKGDDTVESTKTFTYSGLYVSGLSVDLTTKVTVPGTLYATWYRAGCSTVYIEYTNNSEFAIAAPLLHLIVKNQQGEEKAVLTMNPNMVLQQLSRNETTLPDGYSHDMYMIGNGAAVGVLQPGETATIPVYWRGWMGDMEQITFQVEVVAQDNAMEVDWEHELFGILSEQEKADNAAYLDCLQDYLGNTWGEYVVKLSQAATVIYQETGVLVKDEETLRDYLIQQCNLDYQSSLTPRDNYRLPDAPFSLGDHSSAKLGKSVDPNEILGPSGYGDEGWITGDETLAYQINFENDEVATAPAQRVDVEMYLDDDLDWSTFQFTGFGWADVFQSLDTGTYAINKIVETTVVPLDDNLEDEITPEAVTIFVEVTAGIDLLSGRVWASFQTLQYTDLDGSLEEAILLPPMDALVGFLLPSMKEDGENIDSRGDGFLTYTVKAKSDLATETAITSVADIQFDYGEIIATNQVDPHDPTQGTDPKKEVPLTIDRTRPEAQVVTVSADSGPIHLTWEGSDAHSGVSGYAVYVRQNEGDWALWQTFDAETTEAIFTDLVVGATFSFYVTATDNVGWVGGDPESAVSFLVETDLTTRLVSELKSHESTDEIPMGLTELTDWDSFYVEFWSEGTVKAAAGSVQHATIMYDSKLFTMDRKFAVETPEGLTGTITNRTTNAETGQVTLTVQITVDSDADYSAPGANLYWGAIHFVPATGDNVGLPDIYAQSESFGATVKAYAFDLERNDKIDMQDFIEFAKLFNQKVIVDETTEAENSNPLVKIADFDGSGTVDMQDFIEFAKNFNKQKPGSAPGSAGFQPAVEDAAKMAALPGEDAAKMAALPGALPATDAVFAEAEESSTSVWIPDLPRETVEWFWKSESEKKTPWRIG